MHIALIKMKITLSVIVILTASLMAFQISDGETLYPSGYNITSQYSISAARIVIGDTLVITRTITNDDIFVTSGLYFSDNLPPRFDVVEANMNINGADITFESHGPLPNLIKPKYNNYTWVIDDPNDGAINNVLNPGDSFEFQLKLSCDSLGEYLLPLHTTVFYGSNQGLFSTSDSIQIQVVSSTGGDTIPPEFVEICPLDTTIECGVIPDPPVMTATDNYDPVVEVVFNEVIEGNIVTRTWTATDDAGNSVQCNQTITVSDTTSPVIVCSGDILVECGSSIGPEFTGYPTVTDNCNGNPVLSYNDVSTDNIITRTWMATDDAGNGAQCVQALTIEDTRNPEFVETCPPDITVKYDFIPAPPVMTAIDDCDPDVGVVYDEIIGDTIITRTWTATDASGNSIQCAQTINVETGSNEFSRISGQVVADDIALYNAYVNLYNSDGDFLFDATADENGFYSFNEVSDGSYKLKLTVPIGFIPVTDTTIDLSITGLDVEINFELTSEIVNSWYYNYWWWLRQLTYIQRGGVYLSQTEITADEIADFSQSIFDHFYNRDDGFEIQIDSVTYIDNPARPLTFEELSHTFLDAALNDANTQIKRSLRANLLNIAYGKLSQYAIVSVDGATASQALTYLVGLYLSGEYYDLYTANVNLQRMHMRVMIPAGIIPLTTPNIVYKEEESAFEAGSLPDRFVLYQNSPNPFNPITKIEFGLQKASEVKLDIYNLVGQKVATVADGNYSAGYHTVIWDASQFGSGVYLYRIEADGLSDSKKMIFLK